MCETFIVAEVEISFRAVVGDENFAVLERAHGAGVNIEVGVEFLQSDFEAAAFEKTTDGSGGDAFA